MQLHVKTPKIEIKIEGKIPTDLIELIKKLFGARKVQINDDAEIKSVKKSKNPAKAAPKKRGASRGDRVKDLRIQNGWTQKQLSDRTGLAVNVVSDIERDMRPVGPKTAKSLAKAFKQPIENFLD